MFSPWIDIHDVNGLHWVNLWAEVLRLRGEAGRPRRPPLFVFHEHGTVIRALKGQEPLPAGFPYLGAAGLHALAREHGAGLAFGVDAHALARFFAAFESQMRYGEDFLAYVTHVVRALSRLPALGIDVAPALQIPGIPPRLILDALWNAAFPDGTSLALYVFDEGTVYASLLISKENGMLTRLSTDDGLGSEGVRAAEWQKDLPRLIDEINRRFSPLWAGFFVERRALPQLVRREISLEQASEAGLAARVPWPDRFRALEWLWKQGQRGLAVSLFSRFGLSRSPGRTASPDRTASPEQSASSDGAVPTDKATPHE